MDHKEVNQLVKEIKKKYPNVKIIGASKLQSLEKILDFSKSGVDAFGENYAQEFLEKKEKLPGICWHFIGPLQTNKIKSIVGEVELIHSVGRFKEAEEISKQAAKKNMIQNILLEVNIAAEESKHGFLESEIYENVARIKELKSTQILGFMCMPPLSAQPENARPFFKKLKLIAEKTKLSQLSMGTSSDYEIAIKEGATMIRLGEIIFGRRPMQ